MSACVSAKKNNMHKKVSRTKRGKTRKHSSAHALKKPIICLSAAVLFAATVIGAIRITEIMERKTYKLLYLDEILSYSEEFSLDPCLVAAVIHTESSNRANAVSSKGAIGLMQIMPSTGEWIAKKLKLDDYTEEKLNDPDINIRLGCWYIRYLCDKYNGIERTALAAYNAGPGNVDKWLSQSQYGSDMRLDNIPYAETVAYADKVEDAKEKYRELYEDRLCK